MSRLFRLFENPYLRWLREYEARENAKWYAFYSQCPENWREVFKVQQ